MSMVRGGGRESSTLHPIPIPIPTPHEISYKLGSIHHIPRLSETSFFILVPGKKKKKKKKKSFSWKSGSILTSLPISFFNHLFRLIILSFFPLLSLTIVFWFTYIFNIVLKILNLFNHYPSKLYIDKQVICDKFMNLFVSHLKF